MSLLKISGKRPENLGVHNGQLTPCPEDRSTCVCSQQQAEVRGELGPQHIHPFKYAGSAGDAMTRLLAVLLEEPRCSLVTQTRDYVYAEFQTDLLGMIHDVEFLIVPAESVIHVRSAARFGPSDFGMNRARLETLRERFDDAE
ncbi:MAG: hypothetical protein JWQ90_708 [Hydrocarboniphaga sp.]|uniref:DUF1499 domain-containing protein n=1 Tax=Hydrocarboniphaga sp. TaxID=2033016 RepID=UPI00261D57F5|nr:DUF1499 domain-containing protein [Hydrocarboniphaga sp.]MDB5968258.1 hypothetical protein [Hydrocarboniphaga sp.]